ncbi:major facilitator superfamily MFS_1 [Candidatus Vecturithrix granuli]|uniref:Major facilitator superfamily MFS_1 n=1 Tax=Vecturithrix granuli TaxID=1499967 RepID=A0A081C151_VECG1|nr:major facilitator superfamily MFS_1 [Candidatus Vecturithrix granuli]
MEQVIIRKPHNIRKTSTREMIAYGTFFAFFLFGWIGNMTGATLPTILQDLHLSYSQAGTILFGISLGFFLATFLVGPLSDMIGKKAVIFISCGCFVVGILGFSSFSAFSVLTASMFFIGLALGSLEVGGNLIIVDLYPQNKGRYLNLLNFFYGVGSMLVPFYVGFLLSTAISWRTIYRSGLPLVVVLFVYFLLARYPLSISSAPTSAFDWKQVGKSAFSGDMPVFYFIMMLYVAAELGTGVWMVEFLQKAKAQSVMTSSLFLSLFFGMMTVGRFVGSFVVERIGYLKSMVFAALGAILCVAVGTFGPSSLAFVLPVSGLFYSIVFPTLTATVSELHQENIGTILGLLFTFSGLGGMLGPWLIGVLSDWTTIRLGFGIITLFCVIVCITLFWLMKQQTLAKTR